MQRDIKEITWAEARSEVQAVNPELARLIDQISPDNSYKLIKASYCFGDLIVNNGVLQLPITNNKIAAITSAEVNKNFKDGLLYSSIPLSLLLNKSSEIFVYSGERVIPLNVFNPGKLFGTFETGDYLFGKHTKTIWNVIAGARTIFMLAKISEASGVKRLRLTYNIPLEVHLRYLTDHWEMFKRIANHPDFIQPWNSNVLFFTCKWFDQPNDLTWFDFHRYVLKQGWRQLQYAVDKITFGLFWQKFVKALNSRNLKPTSYITDSIKHLFLIATGGAPAFRPDDNSQLVAPTKGFKNAFIETYLLKNYLPTLLYLDSFNARNPSNSVYYSLSLPTLLEGNPDSKTNSTLMLTIKDIKLMINTLLREVDASNNLISQVSFEYFHVEPDRYREILSSDLIPGKDPSFLVDQSDYPNRSFCATSAFWRGCIKISPSIKAST